MHPPYLHSAHAFHPWCREWGMGSNERRREDGGGVWGREGGCEPVASRGGATAGCCPVFHWLHLPWDATLWRRSSDVPSGLSQLPCARLPSSLFADIGPSHMEACLPKHCVNVIQLFFLLVFLVRLFSTSLVIYTCFHLLLAVSRASLQFKWAHVWPCWCAIWEWSGWIWGGWWWGRQMGVVTRRQGENVLSEAAGRERWFKVKRTHNTSVFGWFDNIFSGERIPESILEVTVSLSPYLASRQVLSLPLNEHN